MIKQVSRNTVTDTEDGESYDVLKSKASFTLATLSVSATITLKEPTEGSERYFADIEEIMLAAIAKAEGYHTLDLPLDEKKSA